MAKRTSRGRQRGSAGAPKRKIPVYIDRDIPGEIVRLVRETESDAVRIAGIAAPNMEDQAVWDAAIRHGAMLTTHDDGFWNDQRYPLRVSPGLLLIKGGTTAEILQAMERFTGATAFVKTERESPGFFRGTKVRATRRGFTIKFLTDDSQVVTETYSYDAPASGVLFSTEPQG